MQKDREVEKFLTDYEHPLKAEILTLRQIILDSSLDIREGIKWNSMSFQTTDWFATLNQRATSQIEIVLHLGANKKEGANADTIPDPNGLLKKLAKDRCMLTIIDAEFLRANEAAIKQLMKEWVKSV